MKMACVLLVPAQNIPLMSNVILALHSIPADGKMDHSGVERIQ